MASCSLKFAQPVLLAGLFTCFGHEKQRGHVASNGHTALSSRLISFPVSETNSNEDKLAEMGTARPASCFVYINKNARMTSCLT